MRKNIIHYQFKMIRYQKELALQYNFVEQLPPSVISSLYKYTTGYYQKLNEYLRGVRPQIDSVHRKVLDDLDYAFDAVQPITHAITVYRGNVNDSLDARSYQSTSYDKDVALSYLESNCCLFVITVLPGAKVLPLMTISAHGYEEEFLLDRGGNYRVSYTTVVGGVKYIYVAFEPANCCNYIPEKEVITTNYDDIILNTARESIAENDMFNGITIDDVIAELKFAFERYQQRLPTDIELERLVKLY